MRLKDCKYGLMVITEDKEVGFIVGLTYTCGLEYTGRMSFEEKFENTIPLVAFPNKTRGIHPANIKPFK